jgi:hypothetical protein
MQRRGLKAEECFRSIKKYAFSGGKASIHTKIPLKISCLKQDGNDAR